MNQDTITLLQTQMKSCGPVRQPGCLQTVPVSVILGKMGLSCDLSSCYSPSKRTVSVRAFQPPSRPFEDYG